MVIQHDESSQDLCLSLATDIVCAYLSNQANNLETSKIAGLLNEVYSAVMRVSSSPLYDGHLAHRMTPAVPVEESIGRDYIVCLEDGKKLKMLKRHLKAVYGMTPEDYRARWGLPADYPMVAPDYAQRRSNLAKQIGLGTRERRKAS